MQSSVTDTNERLMFIWWCLRRQFVIFFHLLLCFHLELVVLQGWNSLDTVIAAESLALTLQASGYTKEAKDLLERLLEYFKLGKIICFLYKWNPHFFPCRCLNVRKDLLPGDHIQVCCSLTGILVFPILFRFQIP